MSVSNTINRATVDGDGSNTVFDFSFPAVSAGYLTVIYTDASGNETVLSSSDYTVALNAIAPGQLWAVGGTITYPKTGSPIAAGTTLTIVRTLPLTQLASLVNQGGYYPQVVEQALDLLAMISQQQSTDASRKIGIASTDSMTSLDLPVLNARKGMLLGFNAANGEMEGVQPSGSAILTRDFCTASGSANSLALTTSIGNAITAAQQGPSGWFIAPFTNTGTVDVTRDGVSLGAAQWNGAAMVGGELKAGKSYSFYEDTLGTVQIKPIGAEINSAQFVDTLAHLKAANSAAVSRIYTFGYYSVGDGGGGEYWYDPTDATSADNGGTIIVATDGGRWKLVHNGSTYVDQWGAGPGAASNAARTTAFQTAIDAVFGIGGSLKLRDLTTYVISSALNIPAASGWELLGESRNGSVIEQATTNTPIFNFTYTDTWGWTVKDMTLTYSTGQTTSDTAGCPFYFTGSASNPSFYNWIAKNLRFSNCYYAFGGDETLGYTNWGWTIRDISLDSTVTGGLVDFYNSYGAGNPRCRMDDIYIRADTMAGPIIKLSSTGLTIGTFEINQALLGPQIYYDVGGAKLVVGHMRSEVHDFTGQSVPLFYIANGNVVLDYLELDTFTIDNTGATYPYIFLGETTKTSVDIGVLKFDNSTITNGNTYLFHAFGSATGYGSHARIGTIASTGLPTNCYLTNVGGAQNTNAVTVDQWANGKLSADKGDADYAFAVGDPTSVLYDTPLTALRTVTLEPIGVTTSNAFDGLRMRVIRSVNATGNFGLAIVSDNTTLATLWVPGETADFEFRRDSGFKYRLTKLVRVAPYVTTVANLPAASSVGAGYRVTVSDATTATYGSAPTGGGSLTLDVMSTGSGWIMA